MNLDGNSYVPSCAQREATCRNISAALSLGRPFFENYGLVMSRIWQTLLSFDVCDADSELRTFSRVGMRLRAVWPRLVAGWTHGETF